MNRMITRLNAGKFSVILLLFIVLSFQEIKPQDPIEKYEGIPFIIYPARRVEQMLQYTKSFDHMKQMGVYGVVAPDLFNNEYQGQYNIDSFTVHNLKAIPYYLWGDTLTYQNLIHKYTNSHYTVWEAEGVTDQTKGNATLYHSSHTTVESDTVGYVKTLSTAQNGDTLICGPGYLQNATYNADTAKVHYTIEFRMKIVPIIPQLPDNYQDDIVCKLLVTNILNGQTNEIVVMERRVKVSDFNNLDEWDTIKANYYFPSGVTDKLWKTNGNLLLPDSAAFFVQFKVIWSGLTYLNLYIDKIRVYDDKGDEIVNDEDRQLQIANYIQYYLNNSTIIGWYGTDEPVSIDNFEPFRVVDSIITHVSNSNLRLHAGITGGTTGKFGGWYGRDSMAASLNIDDEFWRRAKPKNIQINCYNFYFPWTYKDLNHPNYWVDDIDTYTYK